MRPASLFSRSLKIALLGLIAAVPCQAEDISAKLKPLIEGKPVPALAAAAVLNGRIVASGATGVRKVGDPTPVTLGDKFHLGSCTKSMTASLAAMLVGEDKIQWTTTAAEIFPDLKIDDGYRKATLRQLLSNTGGAPHDVPPVLWESLYHSQKDEAAQRAELVSGILGQPPAYVPGEGSVYSNAGFSIAGAMLEKASHQSYDKLITTRLFLPLKMASAGFGPPASNDKVEQPYGHLMMNGKLVAIDPMPEGDNPPAITPAGRVHASIEDFARYANFHLGRSKSAPLNKEQLAFLHEPVAPSKDYAMGWIQVERDWAGGPAFTHTGTNNMFFAVMWLAPEKDFAVVAACNSGEGAAVCDAAVWMLIQEYLLGKKPE